MCEEDVFENLRLKTVLRTSFLIIVIEEKQQDRWISPLMEVRCDVVVDRKLGQIIIDFLRFRTGREMRKKKAQ